MSTVLNTILIASGGFVISGYLQKIIDNSDSSISPQISSVIFGTVKLPSVLLAAFLVDKCGRRPLLIISSGGSAIALIAEGVYFYLKEQKQDVSVISWLPTTGLSLYLLFSYFGIHVIPSVVLGEIFTINVKSAAASGVSVYISALSFLLFQFFNPLSNLLGIYTMFWIFAGVCVFGVLFGVLIMIETKGKSFIEIQQLLITNEKGQNSCEVTKDGDSNGVKLNSI
ncbi:hypothetical protein FQR65_LT10561 [Abscondita terminalis]|nr:hypothetical protein FQR65_LT10561 [Abscondita terminalis]